MDADCTLLHETLFLGKLDFPAAQGESSYHQHLFNEIAAESALPSSLHATLALALSFNSTLQPQPYRVSAVLCWLRSCSRDSVLFLLPGDARATNLMSVNVCLLP